MSDMQPYREHVLTLLPKNGVGAEIGVWAGDFSARILEVAAPRVLHLVDPFEIRTDPDHADSQYHDKRAPDMAQLRRGVEDRFADEIHAGGVVLHVGRSQDVLAEFDDGALDFVYIDGDHLYDAVRQDLENAFRVCKRGGLICMDDYATGYWWKDDVVRAAHEFLGARANSCQIVFCHAGQLVIGKR